MRKRPKCSEETKEKIRQTLRRRYLRPELKPLLEELYITHKLSTREIGEQFGLSCMVIRKWLINLKIPLRTISKANKGLKKYHLRGKRHWNWKRRKEYYRRWVCTNMERGEEKTHA